MELEKIKITDIKPADYNPRRISDDEFLKLQNSISTFGVVDPIIINLKNNKIIGGHQRYDVLLDEYMKEGNFLEELHLLRLRDVGWVFPDTDLEIKSEDHEKALNLALNKISGEWDEPKLKDLLEELSLSDLDIELTGFDDLELSDFEDDFSPVNMEEMSQLDEQKKETMNCPHCGEEIEL